MLWINFRQGVHSFYVISINYLTILFLKTQNHDSFMKMIKLINKQDTN